MAKTVFITGGARGIGKAIARRFGEGGMDVLAPARQELDLGSPSFVETYLGRLGGLNVDILVNNAAVNEVCPIDGLCLETWQQVLDTNLTSAFLLLQAAARTMRRRGWGRIVNVSSCYSFLSRPGRATYSASKAALNGLTRTAALEYGPEGILVNAVCPGFVDTEMTRKNNDPEKIAHLCGQTALGRLARPEEVAELVYFLGSDRNTFVTGQTIVIDGGFSIQ